MKYAKMMILTATFGLAAAGEATAATVYVPLGSAGEVLVVDANTDIVIGTIGGLPDIHGLGGAPGARYLVAGSYAETEAGDMSAIARPRGVSKDEHAAHHTKPTQSARAGGAVSILTVIDTATGAPVRRLEVPGAVHHVAVSPDGRYAVATHPNADGVSVIDLSTLEVGDLVRTGPMPNYAVFSPDGTKVYVSNAGNDTVSEIEVGRWIVRRNLVTGQSPEHLAISPDGSTLYVADVDEGAVSALALDEGEIMRSFDVGSEPHGLDISEDGATLFVSAKGEDKIVAVDVRSGGTRTAPLGPAPYHLAVVRGTGKVYVSSREEPKVWVVDQQSLTTVGTIAIRSEGHQMIILP